MYHDHFGLERAPFRITPDTDLFYPGGGRGEVLEALVYAVTSGEGIVKVTGEVGTGKTMLCRMLEVRLPPSVEVVYIANPSLSPEDILHAIALEMSLPVPADAGRLQVMHALQHRLVEKHADNRRVVVFVEEAQGMPTASLEEIRLLSNLETQRDKLLQIVLFGQPELDEALNRDHIRQLRERITHSFKLEPLSREQVREYVRFRMRAVGYRGPDVFRDGAYRLLSRGSEGLVRRVNILADKALLAAFADDTHTVASRHVKTAIEDGQFSRIGGGRRAWWLAGGALLMVLAVALLALARPAWHDWLQRGEAVAEAESPPAPAAVQEPPAAAGSATGTAAATSESGATQPPAAPPPSAAEAPVPATPPSEPGSVALPEPTVPASVPPTSADKLLAEGAASAIASAPVTAGEAAEPVATAKAPGAVAGTEAAESIAADSGSAGSETEDAGVTVSAAAAPVATTAVDTGSAEAAEPVPEAAESPVAERPAAVAVRNTKVNAANRLLARRLEATDNWLPGNRSGRFSIQLMLADAARQNSLEGFLRGMERLGVLEDIYIYETRLDTRPSYGVLYREYGSYGQAREALNALPQSLRRHKPFIRNLGDIPG